MKTLKRIGVLIAAPTAVAALAAGCGGGGTPAPKDISAISACLTKDGYHVGQGFPSSLGPQITVSSSASAKGAEFTVTKENKLSDATSMVGDQKDEFGPGGANTGGSAVNQGPVVVSWARTEPAAEISKVKACAF